MLEHLEDLSSSSLWPDWYWKRALLILSDRLLEIFCMKFVLQWNTPASLHFQARHRLSFAPSLLLKEKRIARNRELLCTPRNLPSVEWFLCCLVHLMSWWKCHYWLISGTRSFYVQRIGIFQHISWRTYKHTSIRPRIGPNCWKN